jgi:hypothetical protein
MPQHNSSFTAPATTNLRIQNNPAALVNPQVLLDQAPILQRQQAVCETHQTIRKGFGHRRSETLQAHAPERRCLGMMKTFASVPAIEG